MKYAFVLSLVAALSLCLLAQADESKSQDKQKASKAEKAKPIQSGLRVGEFIAPFHVTKCAGAEEDGIDAGEETCYVCRNGGRPQVVVFSRSTAKPVAELVRALDKELEKNEDFQLRAIVSLLGEDPDELAEAAGKFAKDSKAKHVPFVVPFEFENGPEDYALNVKADVTILLAVGGKVVVNHAVADAKDLDTEAIVKSLEKILD